MPAVSTPAISLNRHNAFASRRDQMRAHVVVINPTKPLADYYVAFAAASILRLYDTKAEDRCLFGESGNYLRELEEAPTPAGLLEFPREVRKQYLASIHACRRSGYSAIHPMILP